MAKRIVAIVMALFMLCHTGFVFAEDFHGKTLEELIALRNQINAELSARGYDGATIYGFGVYEVGADIEPGSYTLTAIAKDGQWNCEFYIYSSYDDMVKGSNAIDYTNYKFPIMQMEDVNIGFPIRLRLVEGNMLILGAGTYSLSKVK